MVNVVEEYNEEKNRMEYFCSYDGVPQATVPDSKEMNKKNKKLKNTQWEKIIPFINPEGEFDGARYKLICHQDPPKPHHYLLSDPVASDDENEEQPELHLHPALPLPALPALPQAPVALKDINEDEEVDSDAEMPQSASNGPEPDSEEEEDDSQQRFIPPTGGMGLMKLRGNPTIKSDEEDESSDLDEDETQESFPAHSAHSVAAPGSPSHLGFFGMGLNRNHSPLPGEGKDQKVEGPFDQMDSLMAAQLEFGIPLDGNFSLPSNFDIDDAALFGGEEETEETEESNDTSGLGLPKPGQFS